MKVAKYFWNLNEKSLQVRIRTLQNPQAPKFVERMVSLLSRCDRPKELFSLLSKKDFAQAWPRVRAYWIKASRSSEFRDWWETIYEQILQDFGQKSRMPKGESPISFLKIGRLIKDTRVQKGLSQKELALKSGMKQPDISKIEEGKKNITAATLVRICKILDIKTIDL